MTFRRSHACVALYRAVAGFWPLFSRVWPPCIKGVDIMSHVLCISDWPILYPRTCKSYDSEKIVSPEWRGCYSQLRGCNFLLLCNRASERDFLFLLFWSPQFYISHVLGIQLNINCEPGCKDIRNTIISWSQHEPSTRSSYFFLQTRVTRWWRLRKNRSNLQSNGVRANTEVDKSSGNNL